MRLDDIKESKNVEDRRFNNVGRTKVGRGKGGILTFIIVLVGAYYGVDLTGLMGGGVEYEEQTSALNESEEKQLRTLSAKVLTTTENIWTSYFQQNGLTYKEPSLVLYRGAIQTACGTGQSAMGPFYCPVDQKVYLDLSFYDDMRKKLRASGDFAFSYVIAHEVGHHVQNLLGITSKTQRAQMKASSKAEANQISVNVELQADCFAGVWGHQLAKANRLEEGDVEEAFNAAQAVGDDRLQQQSRGYVVPDSFTHGSSAQRLAWFRKGLTTG
ncbi:TPA: neutral zinc metallopeptidase, partial [Mannheimia haemolytica]|nr:neutral zinc metallopeptidase [Mannheimia haemolytica]HDL5109989.1 neutral zinc metallopeptidase [Mannheimia haemolytica]HDL5172797.1 neutral zinc metallopeptidase [Mannheimia haemolytica]HDL5265013.1 neutral zinc metallopeptidase [Mannheimia haemolytica]HDL5344564.1 neutral zinc metallopeptidase [Mannheimia haemolytica]